nr:toll-like receptor 6 [Onthophagus taurus]
MMMLYQTLVLVAAFSFAKSQCPLKCSCFHVPIYPENGELLIFSTVKCSTLNINESLLVPNDTREIIFEGTNVDLELFTENKEFWNALPNLTRVEFNKCKIKSVENVSFNLERLKSLQISNSNLTESLCFNLTELLTLDLSQNKLTSVKNSFTFLVNLQVLNLSANHLVLTEKSFYGLNNLKSLDLSDNQIKQLSDKIFLPLTNLQYLNISKNRLKILNEEWFGNLIHLQQLDVSQNQLEKVIPGNLEFPNLMRLFLAENPNLGISKPPTLLIGMGSRLQTVDASNTGLENVPSALTHSIRALKLSKNSIVTISCGELDYYPLLQVLDFTSNKLKTIEDDALGRLESLTIVYLSENWMVNVPGSLPERLEILHLDKNYIGTIRFGDFLGLKQLELLNLSDNNITKIEENSFNHLLSLSSLDLSRNPLYIPPGLLTIPGKLQSLRLSGIPSLLPAKEVTFPLTTPEYLIILDLSYSPGLAHQLLADTAALAASRQLQELDLSVAGLEYIRSDLLHYLPQLRTLHLKGNPLNCTDLQWLAMWMRRQGEYENREVTCVYPGDIWGVPLIDLQGLDTKVTTTTYTETTITTTSEYQHSINVTEATTIYDNNTMNIEFYEVIGNNGTMMATSHHYYSEKISSLHHPGMLILILGVLLTTAILTVLTTQLSKKRRRQTATMMDMEVGNLPGVTELW